MHDEQSTDQVHEPTNRNAPENAKSGEETDVFSLIEDVERHLSRIRTAQSKQVEEFTDLATRMQALEQAEEALAEDAAQIASDRSALDEERASVEHLRADVHQAREALEQAEKAIQDRSEKVDSELESLREGREALSHGEEELATRTKELEAQAEQLKQRAIEFDTEQERMLAQSRDMEEAVAEHVQRLNAAEEELQASAESAQAAESRCSELDQRCEELTNDAQYMREQLRKAGERLAELAEVVSEQAPLLEEGAAAMASMQDQARTIAQLERQLAQQPVMDEQQAALMQEQQSAMDEQQAAMEKQQAATDEQINALNKKVEQAQKRADELEEALAVAQDKGQAQAFAKQLRDKAEHLSEFARHLDRRKTRLGVLHKGVRELADANQSEHPSTFRDLQRLQSQREDLEETRKCLVESEKAMLSKWARPRALASVAWLVMLLICVCGGSWLVVQNLMPSPGTATVDMVATTRSGRPLENTAIEGWMEWHKALPRDPAFVHVVASRLQARGIAPVGGEEAVAQLLANDLAFDSDGPGDLRLVLAGADRRTVSNQLDVIATSMASESARQAPRREQSARAMIVGESKGTGRVAYASLVPGTIDKAFLTRYAMVSGVALAVALAIVGLVYLMLRRAKRIFEESEMGLQG